MRKTSTAAAVLVALGLLLSLCVGSASANLGYEHEGLFDGITPPGQTPNNGFGPNSPTDLAVNQATHDVYVVDSGFKVVDVFSSTGVYLRQLSGLSAPTGKGLPVAIAVDNSGGSNTGYVYVADNEKDVINVFDPTGAYAGQLKGTSTPAGSYDNLVGVAVGPGGSVFVSDSGHAAINKFVPTGTPVKEADYSSQFTHPDVTPGQVAVDADGNLYSTDAGAFAKFSPAGSYLGNPAEAWGANTSTDVALNDAKDEVLYDEQYVGVTIAKASGEKRHTIGAGSSFGVAADESSHRIYLTNQGYWVDYFKRLELPDVETGDATDVTDTTALINGQVGPDEGPEITSCEVEYGTDTDYTHSTPCDDPPPYSSDRAVTTHLTGLTPGVTYHYRLVVGNSEGKSFGADRTVLMFEPPQIESASSSNVFETSADLNAEINPKGTETTYYFEYGPTPSYGTSIPIPAGSAGDGSIGVEVTVQLTGLAPGTYHFRVVASNKFGTVKTTDHSFAFFPPSCPNSHVRQETAASYLPDCRAYELASPENAGGTTLNGASGPVSPYATNPSRVAFTGLYGTVPGAGGDPMNYEGDLYIATRSNTGWTTRYVGRSGTEALKAGGPPGTVEEGPDKAQLGVMTDIGMDTFLQWDAIVNYITPPSNAPFVYNANGEVLGKYPTTLDDVPGAAAGLDCSSPGCMGQPTASADLEHFVFSSSKFSYVPGGVVGAPGSAYDNDVDADTVSIISKAPGGGDLNIGPDPKSGDPNEFFRFPAISKDGSHILMSTTSRLFMRVDNLVTYEVSQGHQVNFAGMTDDGETVYLTSAEQMTPGDEDTSVDLYMWKAADQSLTLASAGTNGRGNTDDCAALDSWTEKCDIRLINFKTYALTAGGEGGNGHSDSAVAAESGDFYFYAPEMLDEDRGLRNARNLFVFRNGEIKFVATMRTDSYCNPENVYQGFDCTDGPIGRLQVTPNGSRVAFITHTRLTAYDNYGFGRCDRFGGKCEFNVAEMYIWSPETREILCVSCIPSGARPSGNAYGSQNGRFMTDDGRVFFATEDALTPRDTNKIIDVYEYVEGRAQLISPGVGDSTRDTTQTGLAFRMKPGLVGVSADGTDAYFATYEVLVGQDRNGNELKIYDARANGGIPFNPPPPPCPAADECHGDSSRAPAAAEVGTGAYLGDVAKKKKKKRAGKKNGCKAKKSAKKKKPACKKPKKRKNQNPIVGAGRGGAR